MTLDFGPCREYLWPIQPGEGRVMTVFIAQGWMRVAATTPGLKDADYGWNVREPWRKGDKRRRACPAKRLRREPGRALRSAKARSMGRADGPSACPGGSPHEPGGVATKAPIPGDTQQAEKSIRVRNAGGFLRLRRSRGFFGPAGSCDPRGHTPPCTLFRCTEP